VDRYSYNFVQASFESLDPHNGSDVCGDELVIVGTHVPVVVLTLHVDHELVAFRVLRDRYCVHLDDVYLSVYLYTARVSEGWGILCFETFMQCRFVMIRLRFCFMP